MPIPLLEYSPSAQNQRVAGFEVPGDDQPRVHNTEVLLSADEMDALIGSAYRQVFHEQQMLSHHRQTLLESQLKSGQITVKAFIRGLATSDAFRRLNYDVNNNYRFVELCVPRILGRKVYSDREKMAWSIVLATQGLPGFIDTLLNSEEYMNRFGDHTVPYQQRRTLANRSQGELPFERMARYGTDYRDQLPRTGWLFGSGRADGLFGQFEPFDFDTFIRRANWPVTAGLFIVLFILIAFSLTLATTASSSVG
ncbi:phycobilisome rod-core linker polypeptide CpcG [Leptolyngbya sp. 'hensonii']|uniref:phycobilisome rod-core linker polypeptide n=1 Tax=Leptolyngbya sp. 'hensonii' TaxID=1922337 RepID=UPI00094FB774|nr:phycobilisome rod-core linker polypeptide [Leptolyngbya sp. 'hensonii']OLP18564.1 phycobilisome rod-core linker polypeptide CpcG [Leptolyngbya sp. 'hensonii']